MHAEPLSADQLRDKLKEMRKTALEELIKREIASRMCLVGHNVYYTKF